MPTKKNAKRKLETKSSSKKVGFAKKVKKSKGLIILIILVLLIALAVIIPAVSGIAILAIVLLLSYAIRYGYKPPKEIVYKNNNSKIGVSYQGPIKEASASKVPSSDYSFRLSDIVYFIFGLLLGFGINIIGGSITLNIIVMVPALNMILLTILNILIVKYAFKSRNGIPIGVGIIAFYLLFLLAFGSCFVIMEPINMQNI